MFAVREPFHSKQSQTSLIAGIVTVNKPLVIQSFMLNNGVILPTVSKAIFYNSIRGR
jgi:hypothetical protein